jgi:hypothetical protein
VGAAQSSPSRPSRPKIFWLELIARVMVFMLYPLCRVPTIANKANLGLHNAIKLFTSANKIYYRSDYGLKGIAKTRTLHQLIFF